MTCPRRKSFSLCLVIWESLGVVWDRASYFPSSSFLILFPAAYFYRHFLFISWTLHRASQISVEVAFPKMLHRSVCIGKFAGCCRRPTHFCAPMSAAYSSHSAPCLLFVCFQCGLCSLRAGVSSQKCVCMIAALQ